MTGLVARSCSECSEVLRRREGEKPSQFAKRRTCSSSCAYSARARASSAKPRPLVPEDVRFWVKVQGGDFITCWSWTGATSAGYGHFGGATGLAHRWAYEALVGEIPTGLVLDHQCHNADPDCRDDAACLHRRCVNPWRLEPVPQRLNTARGKAPSALLARGDVCGYGHKFTVENTYYPPGRSRVCITCRKRRDVASKTHRKGRDVQPA